MMLRRDPDPASEIGATVGIGVALVIGAACVAFDLFMAMLELGL